MRLVSQHRTPFVLLVTTAAVEPFRVLHSLRIQRVHIISLFQIVHLTVVWQAVCVLLVHSVLRARRHRQPAPV